jgi:hypothetical protein
MDTHTLKWSSPFSRTFCFVLFEALNKDEPQLFKIEYIGRIVTSTGEIATDTKDNNDNTSEWISKYDKDGITIEDALPMVELSRTKKDKRAFFSPLLNKHVFGRSLTPLFHPLLITCSDLSPRRLTLSSTQTATQTKGYVGLEKLTL